MQHTHPSTTGQPLRASPAHALLAWLGAASRHIALLAAWVATCGSLFFSEVLGWLPCVLCWYQRILMYPLALLLAIGILRRDSGVQWYVLPLSLCGGGISLYHYLLTKTNLFPPPVCASGVSCTVDYLNWFGFINIPFLALTAFTIITLMMLLAARSPYEASDEDLPTTVPVSRMAVFAIIALVAASFVVGARFV